MTEPMEQSPIEAAVAALLRDFGATVLTEPTRVRAVLTDLLADQSLRYRADIDALTIAASSGVAARAASASPTEQEALVAELVAAGVAPEVASTTVGAYRRALAPNTAPTDTPSTPSPANADLVGETALPDDAFATTTVPATAGVADAGSSPEVAPDMAPEPVAVAVAVDDGTRRRWALAAAVAAVVVLIGGASAFALGTRGGTKKAVTTTATSTRTTVRTTGTTAKKVAKKVAHTATTVKKVTVTTVPTPISVATTTPRGVTRTTTRQSTILCWDGSVIPSNQNCPPTPVATTTTTSKPAPPPDSDGDKTPNFADKCPTTQGPTANSGCPYLTVSLSGPSGSVEAACSGTYYAVYNVSVGGARSWYWSNDAGAGHFLDNSHGASWTWSPSPYSHVVKVTVTGLDGTVTSRQLSVSVNPPPPPGAGC